MTLKYIDINRHGILVDENAEIKEGEKFCHLWYKDEWNNDVRDKPIVSTANSHTNDVKGRKNYLGKVVFAEKELNLDVPILPNWKDWEVERKSMDLLKNNDAWNHLYKFGYPQKPYPTNYKNDSEMVIAGYNHNKVKYTELIEYMFKHFGSYNQITKKVETVKDVLQSLQKLPKYIVMESEYPTNCCIVKDGGLTNMNKGCAERNRCVKPKLITNSEGKQEGIIKEIVYE